LDLEAAANYLRERKNRIDLMIAKHSQANLEKLRADRQYLHDAIETVRAAQNGDLTGRWNDQAAVAVYWAMRQQSPLCESTMPLPPSYQTRLDRCAALMEQMQRKHDVPQCTAERRAELAEDLSFVYEQQRNLQTDAADFRRAVISKFREVSQQQQL
jgi:hypothetical protein